MHKNDALRELRSLHKDVLEIIHDVERVGPSAPVPPEKIQSRLESIERTGRDNLFQIVKYYLYEGRAIFGMETGLVAQFKGDDYLVKGSVTDLPVVEGMVFKLCETYCAEIHRTGETYTLMDAAANDTMLSHPVYQNLKLRAYIGAPIWVGDYLYGTISFSSRRPRDAFFGYETRVVELLSRLVSRCLAGESDLLRKD